MFGLPQIPNVLLALCHIASHAKLKLVDKAFLKGNFLPFTKWSQVKATLFQLTQYSCKMHSLLLRVIAILCCDNVVMPFPHYSILAILTSKMYKCYSNFGEPDLLLKKAFSTTSTSFTNCQTTQSYLYLGKKAWL